MRYAYVPGPPDTIKGYLPNNYSVVGTFDAMATSGMVNTTILMTVIAGEDTETHDFEWIVDQLEHGLWFGAKEVKVKTDEEFLDWCLTKGVSFVEV